MTQGYFSTVGRFESEFEIMTNYLGYLDNSSVPEPAWMYNSTSACVQTLTKPYSSESLWSCFSLSQEFNAVRAAKKFLMPHILSAVTSRVVHLVQQEINTTNQFNLQFLVIVLVFITISLGVSWMAILIRDNRDVHNFLPSSPG